MVHSSLIFVLFVLHSVIFFIPLEIEYRCQKIIIIITFIYLNIGGKGRKPLRCR